MSDDRLLVPATVRATLAQLRVAGGDREVCGVLLGERGAGRGPDADGRPDADGNADGVRGPDRVREVVPVENVASDPERLYELDPEATLAAVDAGEARGLEVVGFYHSHPRGPAEPSATDRDRATWTGYVYCLVAPGALRAYRWTGEAFRPLRVETP